MIIKTGPVQYGCFKARCVCENCNKTNEIFDLSWNKHDLAPSKPEELKKYIDDFLINKEHLYCIKCGKSLF